LNVPFEGVIVRPGTACRAASSIDELVEKDLDRVILLDAPDLGAIGRVVLVGEEVMSLNPALDVIRVGSDSAKTPWSVEAIAVVSREV